MPVPVFTLKIEGAVLPSRYALQDLDIHHELNRVPEATATFEDGSAAARSFALSNEEFFEPGKEVSISVRYEGKGDEEIIFRGLVISQAVEVSEEHSLLRVGLKDPSFRLTRQRKSAVFRGKSSDAIRSIVEDAGLSLGDISDTAYDSEEMMQYYASDWDFMVSRADAEGLVVRVLLGEVSVLPMAGAGGGAKAKISFGLSELQAFELEVDGGTQAAEIASIAWDLDNQQASDPTQGTDLQLKAGNLDPKEIAEALGANGPWTLLHPVPMDPAELQAWADARLARNRLAFIRGRMVVRGRTDIVPGDQIEIDGVGDRFNGTVLVSGVTHRRGQEDLWETEFQIGLTPDGFAQEPNIAEVPAAGLLPPIEGLRVATVANFEEDSQGQHRIKVLIPGLPEDQGSIWARAALSDAGSERGNVFWPEPGDEVVLGFLAADPRQAVILGSLFSKANSPPELVGPPSDENPKRAIVTVSGIEVFFDDEKKSVTISTPAKNRIVIDDEAMAITLVDQNKNKLIMNDSGVSVTTEKDLVLEAKGNVEIKGQKVDVK